MGKAVGVVVFVLMEVEGELRILYLQRSGGRFAGQWWPVAGTCEKDEKPINTAVRELKEETGLSPDRIYTFWKEIIHANRDSHIESYVVYVLPESNVILNYEHSEFRWATVSESIEFVPEPYRKEIKHVELMKHIESNFINREPSGPDQAR
jgi:dATP pyrophosphohydrolase